jgi:hypothetical protein
VFTARYALSPYIKQINFAFKGFNIRCAAPVYGNSIADFLQSPLASNV